MTTLIPADLHLVTAKGTESLGGSYKEIKPIKVKLANSKLNFSGEDTSKLNPKGYYSLFKCNLAKPRTLSPFFPNFKLTF